jgi:hypothetical protein
MCLYQLNKTQILAYFVIEVQLRLIWKEKYRCKMNDFFYNLFICWIDISYVNFDFDIKRINDFSSQSKVKIE